MKSCKTTKETHTRYNQTEYKKDKTNKVTQTNTVKISENRTE